MSIIYAIVLCAVFISFVAVTVDAVLNVSKPQPWEVPRVRLSLIEPVERRTQGLPFVGAERRADAQHPAGQETSSERLVA